MMYGSGIGFGGICLTTLLIVTGALLFGLFLGGILYLGRKAKRNKILKQGKDLLPRGDRFGVVYCSKDFYSRQFTMSWEKIGILFVSNNRISFISTKTRKPEIVFNPAETRIDWIGVNFFTKGWPAWIRILTESEEHYFGVEQKFFLFSSYPSQTKPLYEKLKQICKYHDP